MTPVGILLGVDIRMELLRIWEWTGLGKLDGGGNLVLDLGVDAGLHRRIELSARQHNLIVLYPRTQFIASPVARVIVLARSNVLLPAIGVAFDEHRTGALAQPGIRFRRNLPERDYVRIANLVSRDAV